MSPSDEKLKKIFLDNEIDVIDFGSEQPKQPEQPKNTDGNVIDQFMRGSKSIFKDADDFAFNIGKKLIEIAPQAEQADKNLQDLWMDNPFEQQNAEQPKGTEQPKPKQKKKRPQTKKKTETRKRVKRLIIEFDEGEE